MNIRMHSLHLLALLVVFGCVFASIVFFTSFEVITASEDPSSSISASSIPYPPPQGITQAPIYSDDSSLPYPPPVTQEQLPASIVIEPTPTPRQVIQIPVDISFEQAAITYIAQFTEIDPDSLTLIETQLTVVPITQKKLWACIIVNTDGKGNPIYQVLIDEDQRIMLSGTGIDPQSYWDEAESLFRIAKQNKILSQVGQQYMIPEDSLSIAKGVFLSYPLSKTVVWHGKIEAQNGNIYDYAVALDGSAVDLISVESRESEARTKNLESYQKIYN